jgi:glycosyltransferase involved in cell wall biosynthesis
VADVLWVTAETPRFDRGGGNIRQANLLVRLAAAHRITLVDAGEGQPDPAVVAAVADVVAAGSDRPPARELGRIGQRARDVGFVLGRGEHFEADGLARARRGLAAEVRRWRGDVVVVQHGGLAALVEDCRAGASVLELHNDPVERSRQQALVAPHWRHRLLWEADRRKAARAMRRYLPRYDALVCTSVDDQRRLPAAAWVVPNGVDIETFRPTPLPRSMRVAFTATMHYEPNIDGARWFVAEVLPLLLEQVPDATLELVGRTPTPPVRDLLAHPAVDGSFDVPDVRPHLAAARVAIVPIRVGTGTRLKALEAMAAGRPVVGTTIGLEGLGIVPGRHALVADDPAGFADAVARLLRDDELAGGLATAARRLVEEVHGWDPIAAAYADRLAVLGATRR